MNRITAFGGMGVDECFFSAFDDGLAFQLQIFCLALTEAWQQPWQQGNQVHGLSFATRCSPSPCQEHEDRCLTLVLTCQWYAWSFRDYSGDANRFNPQPVCGRLPNNTDLHKDHMQPRHGALERVFFPIPP